MCEPHLRKYVLRRSSQCGSRSPNVMSLNMRHTMSCADLICTHACFIGVQNAVQDPPKGLQWPSKMHPKYPLMTTPQPNTSWMLKNITFFWPALPWGRPQTPQNALPKASRINRKRPPIVCSYRHRLSMRFQLSQTQF